MSELQISLLGIGIFVVLAVWGYGWWQQRQYRRRFGEVFEKKRDDVLQPVAQNIASDSEGHAEAAIEEAVQAIVDAPARASTTDDSCALVDNSSDYVTMIYPGSPIGISALTPLWEQRFDFGKPINACGLNSSSSVWERVIPDSPLLYDSFKISLQLVDRTGAISETRIAAFRELIRQIGADMSAETECPDVADAAKRALALDAVCAEVDQIIGLNLVPRGDRPLLGAEIVYVASQNGFTLQADGAFQFLDARGLTLFSLSNLDNVPFQHHLLNQMSFSGLTLLLEVPRVENPVERFDEMLAMAKVIAASLRANVVDDRRKPLGDESAALIREQVIAIEQTMLAHQLIPGNPQALRLFA